MPNRKNATYELSYPLDYESIGKIPSYFALKLREQHAVRFLVERSEDSTAHRTRTSNRTKKYGDHPLCIMLYTITIHRHTLVLL